MYVNLGQLHLKFDIFDNICSVKIRTSKSFGRYEYHVSVVKAIQHILLVREILPSLNNFAFYLFFLCKEHKLRSIYF